MSNSVTVSETKNTVSVNETTNTVTVTSGDATTVEIATQGPQGASSADTINMDDVVNKSVVYYDGSSSSLKANNTWTVDTLTNGGNF